MDPSKIIYKIKEIEKKNSPVNVKVWFGGDFQKKFSDFDVSSSKGKVGVLASEIKSAKYMLLLIEVMEDKTLLNKDFDELIKTRYGRSFNVNGSINWVKLEFDEKQEPNVCKIEPNIVLDTDIWTLPRIEKYFNSVVFSNKRWFDWFKN